jgi:hypothetical protein
LVPVDAAVGHERLFWMAEVLALRKSKGSSVPAQIGYLEMPQGEHQQSCSNHYHYEIGKCARYLRPFVIVHCRLYTGTPQVLNVSNVMTQDVNLIFSFCNFEGEKFRPTFSPNRQSTIRTPKGALDLSDMLNRAIGSLPLSITSLIVESRAEELKAENSASTSTT